MTTWQRRLPLALIACSLLALGILNATMGTQPTAERPTAQPSALPSLGDFSDPSPRIAIAYGLGGRGTAGFNELAWEGVKRAADALGAELKEVAAKPNETDADREERLRELADARYYPIFAIGSAYAAPLAKVAPKYPGTWFAIVGDGTVDGPNVIGIRFNDEQGAFLVGAAAALTSRTGKVGFVGAAQIPLLGKLEAGFTAGARAAKPHVTVRVAYLSHPPDETGLNDSAKARKAAMGMYDAGVDVIFGADSESGSGVVQAASDRERWAIGVGSDQYLVSDPSLRGAILTSMLERVDVGTFTIAMEVGAGVPKDGINVFGLDRGGVGYSTSGGFVDPIRARLDAFAARIASGQIVVPTAP